MEGHFLRLCKAVAKQAGTDLANFWLHKFRDTFATWALRRGVDIRTVQHWLGHADITVTQRYLAPEQGEHAQRQDQSGVQLQLARLRHSITGERGKRPSQYTGRQCFRMTFKEALTVLNSGVAPMTKPDLFAMSLHSEPPHTLAALFCVCLHSAQAQSDGGQDN